MDIKKTVKMSQEDFIAYAEKEGIELTDEQMDAISGGAAWDSDSGPDEYETQCTICKRTIRWPASQQDPVSCPYCGHTFIFE